MVFSHGKGAYFALDTLAAGNALSNVSDWTDTTDLNRVIEAGETTTYGDDNKTYIVGLEDHTIALGGKWDPALNTVMVGTGASEVIRDFEFGPAGNSTGDVKFSGDCIVTNFSISVSVDGVVTWSADMQVTGDVAVGAF